MIVTNVSSVKVRWKCNMCGNEINDEPAALVVNKTIGYGSYYDMDKLRLKMCAACMDRMIQACAISPIVEDT